MNKLTATTIDHHSNIITKLVEDCYNESDIDNKVKILSKIIVIFLAYQNYLFF
jgi:hypothetical protein